jgi:hypothetical protein
MSKNDTNRNTKRTEGYQSDKKFKKKEEVKKIGEGLLAAPSLDG